MSVRMSTEAERAAAAAKWRQAVGVLDPRAVTWAEEALDRVETDQADQVNQAGSRVTRRAS